MKYKKGSWKKLSVYERNEFFLDCVDMLRQDDSPVDMKVIFCYMLVFDIEQAYKELRRVVSK